MKTCTTEQIEKYLFGRLSTSDRLLFEANLIIDPQLRQHVKSQKKVYTVICQSGRRELKREVEQIHQRLFSDPEKTNFQGQIYKLFQQQ
jgi:hypothetical protein